MLQYRMFLSIIKFHYLMDKCPNFQRINIMLAVYIIGFTIHIKHSSYICLICISNCYICAIVIVKGIDQAFYMRALQPD